MMKDVHIIWYGFYALFALCIANFFNFSDTGWSLLYVVSAFVSSYVVWCSTKGKLSIFFFYIITYHFFIGGRFFSHLFNPKLEVFHSTYWYLYDLKPIDKTILMNYVLGFLFFCVIGYLITNRKDHKVRFEPKLSIIEQSKISKFLNGALYIISPYVLLISFQGFMTALSQGYGVNMMFDSEYNIGYVQKFANLLLIAFTGMAMAYGDRKLIIKYFVVYIIKGLFTVLGGSRGTLGSVIFMALWAYSFYRPVNFKKLSIYAGLGVVALLLLFSVSVRSKADGFSSLSFIDSATAFLYTNGISLMVFDASTKVYDYPLLPYFQTFITGANFIYSLFSGVHLDSQDVTFQSYMCYQLSPDLFNQGLGLGWTTNSDLYLFSGRLFPVYCLLSYILGAVFCFIDQWSRKSRFFLYFAASMAPALFLMARGSLAALFPQIPYSYLFFFLVKWIALKFNYKNRVNIVAKV